MSYSSVVLALSPVIFWKLDETSGTTANDSSGNSRNGTHTSVTLNQTSLLGDASGASTSYNGTSSVTSLSSGSYLESVNVTISMRVKWDGTQQFVASRWNGGASRPWLLYITSGGKLVIQLDNSGVLVTGGTTMVSGSTYTVGFRTNGSTVQVFVNGVSDGSTSSAGIFSTGASLDLARASSVAYTTLNAQGFAFWTSALSDANMLALHNAAVASSAASGPGSISLSGTVGATAGSGSITGSVTASASAAAQGVASGVTGSLSLSGTASSGPVTGALTPSLAVTGAAGGTGGSGSVTGSLSASGSAAVSTGASGSITGSLSIAGTATIVSTAYPDVFEQFEGASAGTTITTSNTTLRTVGSGGKFTAGGATGQYARANNFNSPSLHDIATSDSTTTIAADDWTVRAKFKITDTFVGTDPGYYLIDGGLGQVGLHPSDWTGGTTFNYAAVYNFGSKTFEVDDDNGATTPVSIAAYLGTWIDVIFQGTDGIYQWTVQDNTGTTIATGTRSCTGSLYRARSTFHTYRDDAGGEEFGVDDIYAGLPANDPLPEPSFSGGGGGGVGLPLNIDGTTQAATWSIGLGAPDEYAMADLVILDPDLTRAPTSVQIIIYDCGTSEDLVISIDGIDVFEVSADVNGYVAQTSIPIDETTGLTLNAGTHTLTATGSVSLASQDFTLANDPDTHLIVQGPDADPVEIPEATATPTRRWVLQDLLPGGLGSWAMPINPTSADWPGTSKTTTTSRSTANAGVLYVTEGGYIGFPVNVTGYCPNQEFYEQMQAYAALERRIYLIDDQNRAWTVAITSFDPKLRKRQVENDGSWQDWAADYTLSMWLFRNTYKTPVSP